MDSFGKYSTYLLVSSIKLPLALFALSIAIMTMSMLFPEFLYSRNFPSMSHALSFQASDSSKSSSPSFIIKYLVFWLIGCSKGLYICTLLSWPWPVLRYISSILPVDKLMFAFADMEKIKNI